MQNVQDLKEAKRNFVSNKDESPRIFANNFLDFFSRVHWSIPLFTWVPVVLVSLYWSLVERQLPVLNVAGYFVAAFFSWTVAEYLLHRFLFHFHPTTELGKRISFITHGVHHDYPNDSKRLVMPPALSVFIALPFWFGFQWAFGEFNLAFFAGFLTGYLIYDMMHYALHHANVKWAWFAALKEHHMIHHYAEPENGFGVSSKMWDYIFRTTFKKNSPAS